MQKFLDRFAIGVSGLCAVHCLFTPVAITVFPMMALPFAGSFHIVLYALIVPTSGYGLFMGCRRHKDKMVVLLGLAGLIFLSVALLMEFSGHSDMFIHSITIGGGVLLTLAHVRNFILCRHDHCEH